MIFSGLILMKISEIREDGLFHSSSLLFVLINSLVIILIYADLGPFYSKFKRDALLVIFMLLGLKPQCFEIRLIIISTFG